MKYRPNRRSLASSMAKAIEVEGRSGLLAQLRSELDPWLTFDDNAVKIEPYGGDDNRIGWKNVHIITLDGFGVLGFCEGPAV
jgi:hypothetical protein